MISLCSNQCVGGKIWKILCIIGTIESLTFSKEYLCHLLNAIMIILMCCYCPKGFYCCSDIDNSLPERGIKSCNNKGKINYYKSSEDNKNKILNFL